MTDSKQVLLARPHPFIVTEMQPLLKQGGFSAVKLERLTDLPVKIKNAKGAVISLALASPIPESPQTVFAKLRQSAPTVPVLFAALLDFSMASRTLEELAKQAGIQATILAMDARTDGSIALGKPSTFLYVSNADLASVERKALVARLIQQHFR